MLRSSVVYAMPAVHAALIEQPRTAWSLLEAAGARRQAAAPHPVHAGRAMVHAYRGEAGEALAALAAVERGLETTGSPARPHGFAALPTNAFEHLDGWGAHGRR